MDVDGYAGFLLAHSKPTQIQQRVTLKLWTQHLAAARASIPDFPELETAVVAAVAALTGLPELQLVRAHFLDQDYAAEPEVDTKRREAGSKQASFAWCAYRSEQGVWREDRP